MRKVIGVGETILDIIFKNNQPHIALPGGSVFNGFITLSRLEIPVVFISELGNDKVGDIVCQFMQENHLSTDYVDRFPDGKSHVSLAFLNDKQNAEYLFYKNYPNQRLEVSLPVINNDDIFIFGSYYALNPALRDKIVELLDYARERKAIIYYDPNFRSAHASETIRLIPTVLDNLEYADIVRGSDEDFINLFGKPDMKYVYKERISYYCRNLITTHGHDGVKLFSDNFEEHFDSPSITPISTIGAGDAFNAGLIYGLLKYDIRRDDLAVLNKLQWEKLIRCGIDMATEVCLSDENYISKKFASIYREQS